MKSKILPKLHARIEAVLGKHGWTLALSEDEAEEMTLVFHYPPVFGYKSYLRPQIKMEFGRGDLQPSLQSPVTPFVAEEFPYLFREKSATIAVLDCERTFWEKVTLLHAENHRPDLANLKPRMSRHWSDVAVMSMADLFRDDRLSVQMLQEVIRFKQIYFAGNWAHYETALPGTLQVLPNDNLAKVLRDDYAQMKEMFPVASLSFDEILKKLESLQTRLNSLKFTL